MSNEGQPPHLDNIRDRVWSYQTFTEIQGTRPKLDPFSIQGLLRFIEEEDSSPVLLRSEQLVSEEECALLREQIQTVRGVLVENGLDFTHHPDVADWIEDGSIAWHSVKNVHFYRDHQGESIVNEDLDNNHIWYFFHSSFRFDSLGTEVRLLMDDEDSFNLEIDFPDVENSGKVLCKYRSGTIPLEEVTREEYEIVTYFLDNFAAKFPSDDSQI